jgi:hypothetical protein
MTRRTGRTLKAGIHARGLSVGNLYDGGDVSDYDGGDVSDVTAVK